MILCFDEWAESKHPRDNDGKFSSTGGGGGKASSSAGLTGWKKTWWQAGSMKSTLKKSGFSMAESEKELPTWIHPSGLKVVVHPPKSEGQKNTSEWKLHKADGSVVPGSGAAKLDDILNAGVQVVQQKQTQAAVAKVEASSAQKNKVTEFVDASNGFLKKKGYTTVEPAAMPLHAGGGDLVFKTTGGARVQIDPATGDWIAQTPGHMTKKGSGYENLEKLLSGQPAVFKSGETPPWQNTSVPIVTKSEEQQQTAQQAAQQKLVDTIEQHYADLKKAAPVPTSAEKQALSLYTGSGYGSINSTLRHAENPGGYVDGHVKALDAWLEKSELPQDMTLYRGVGGEYAKILKSILLEGTKFVDKGFGSTSASQSFSESWKSGGLLFKINVKKGTKGAAVGAYSTHPQEKEVLLPRNTIYKVKSYDPKSGHVEVDVEHHK